MAARRRRANAKLAGVELGAARREALRRAAGKEPVSPRVQISEMQRARLLSAAIAVVDDVGYAGASVAHIASRARVSRRTFYDLFANREECLLAVMEDAVATVAGDLAAADVAELPWRERMRAGLWTILCFCDRDPVLARVCVVQSSRGSQRVLERREQILTNLAGWLDEGRLESERAAQAPRLTAEGLVGAISSILYTRLLDDEREPLSNLLGELMGMIVLPYQGVAPARRERDLPAPGPAPALAPKSPRGAGAQFEDPLKDIPMRLTYRTARVLEVTAANPGASNRVVGEGAGIFDQGQVSKLLARLKGLGLIENTGAGQAKGATNAWRLTELGERVAEQLSLDTNSQQDSAA